MAKKICGVCAEEIGFLGGLKIYDGYICDDCKKKSRLNFDQINNVKEAKGYTMKHIRQTISGEIPVEHHLAFLVDNKKDSFGFVINRASGTWYDMDLLHPIHQLDDIVGYSYYEDDAKHSVGRTLGHAAVGGILFGGSGAVVGTIIGNTQKRKIKKAGFLVTKNVDGKDEEVDILLRKNITAGSAEYSHLMSISKRIAEEFDNILKAKGVLPSTGEAANTSQGAKPTKASEILELKQLYDQGIITEEEFIAGKNNILKGN